MKLINKFKSFLLALMASTMMLTIGSTMVYATDNNNIASGIYEVENHVYHEQEIGMTMSRSFLEPTMTVDIRKNSIEYTIGFIPSEYMESYRMKLNGQDVNVEVIQEDESVKVKLKVDKIDADMEAVIYVGPMGRDVEFNVIPNIETLTLIEAIEENGMSRGTIVTIIGGIVIIAVILILVLRKKKA